MTPLREAFVLPGLFLTVTLLGGLRVADTIRLIPPPLSALVLAVLLVTALVRARVLVPPAFLDQTRTPVENLSGAIVLIALLSASAQAINLLVPERGLLHFAFAVLLFVQLLSLSAAGIDRTGMLRSLFVLLGSVFVLRFIVLESLYAADGGTLKRVLTALMSGVTLGGIEYQPHSPITGYIAFVTLALFMIGLVLLPARPAGHSSALAHVVRNGLTVPLLLIAVISSAAGCGGVAERTAAKTAPSEEGKQRREAMLAAARVWSPPPVPPGEADLGVNPPGPGGFGEYDEVPCRLVVERVGGLTPKFNCQLADGRTVKVKYGKANQELYAEVAATRLVSALGFAADRMYVVQKVQCSGCPRFPFRSLRCMASTGLKWPCFPAGVDFENARTFDPVVIERRLEGRRLEGFPDQGWAWYELDRIDPARGGSSRVEVDAMKLLAVFLAHWDNKAENQRLICPPGADLPDGGCARPIAMMQDLGATFGPKKVEIRNWRASPIWSDARACGVSMEHLPFAGATFPEQQISEGGRRFLLNLLEQLSTLQLEMLFTSSRMIEFDGVTAASRNPSAWAGVFLDKVRQIRDAGPCPTP
jgi:hypothetical protein